MAMPAWEDGCKSEVAFWRNWLKGEGPKRWRDDLASRLDPDRPLVDCVERAAKELHQSGIPKIRILEVGSGPLSKLGCRSSVPVLATHSDPLAFEYFAAMRAVGVGPMHGIAKVTAERLVERFGDSTFHIVYCHNALDHCQNPLLALCNMLAVTRPHGYVILDHYDRVTRGNGYDGLHQWDLIADGDTTLLVRDDHQVDLGFWFSTVATQTTETYMEGDRKLVRTTFHKRTDP